MEPTWRPLNQFPSLLADVGIVGLQSAFVTGRLRAQASSLKYHSLMTHSMNGLPDEIVYVARGTELDKVSFKHHGRSNTTTGGRHYTAISDAGQNVLAWEGPSQNGRRQRVILDAAFLEHAVWNWNDASAQSDNLVLLERSIASNVSLNVAEVRQLLDPSRPIDMPIKKVGRPREYPYEDAEADVLKWFKHNPTADRQALFPRYVDFFTTISADKQPSDTTLKLRFREFLLKLNLQR